jgi:hypothetical protein
LICHDDSQVTLFLNTQVFLVLWNEENVYGFKMTLPAGRGGEFNPERDYIPCMEIFLTIIDIAYDQKSADC